MAQQNQRRGGNAQQGNQRGGQQAAAQPQQAQQPNRPPQGGSRLAISHLSETPTKLRIIVKVTVNNSPVTKATPVHFNVGSGTFLTAVVMTSGNNGEAEYTYTKKPGEKFVTIKATAKVAGDPSESQLFVYEKPVAIKGVVDAPIKVGPFAISTHEVFGDEQNRWYTMVGVKVMEPEVGQTVTLTGRILGTEPPNNRRYQRMPLDENGTAFATFEAELEVPSITVLVSTKGLPAETVRIERPRLNAGINCWCNIASVIPAGNGTHNIQVRIEGTVLHDIWRDNRRVSVYCSGADPQFVRTHDGLFEADFLIDPELVPDLNDLIRFGALLVGTEAESSGSIITPDWTPLAGTLAHRISREWFSWRDFGSQGMSFSEHIRQVWSALHSIRNCTAMVLLWVAALMGISTLLPHTSFYFFPLPMWELVWLPVVCYWWLVQDIQHQRRKIKLFHWTWSGFAAAITLGFWFFDYAGRHNIDPGKW